MKTVLIHSPNWLGDVIMSLPAWRSWRNSHSDCRAIILAKKSVAGFWSYVRDVDRVIVLDTEKGGMRKAVAEIREEKCDEAVLLPQSFRSAALAWRGQIPFRRGTAGQFRSLLITDCVSLRGLAGAHQQFEYARLLGVEKEKLPSPAEAVEGGRLPVFEKLAGVDLSQAMIVLPGAARGGSKRWPSEYFAEVAIRALAEGNVRNIYICGTKGEADACMETQKGIQAKFSDRAENLCGQTNLGELSWILKHSKIVCCNDSGGMHLATAMGVPVVAIFGMTDPQKTGPLGWASVVAAEGVKVSRAIPRESEEAVRALRSVKPERVYSALVELLAKVKR